MASYLQLFLYLFNQSRLFKIFVKEIFRIDSEIKDGMNRTRRKEIHVFLSCLNLLELGLSVLLTNLACDGYSFSTLLDYATIVWLN